MADSSGDLLDTLPGRILRGLHAGVLREGDRLSSTRALATEFDVDHRPILAAYQKLADEGLLELRERGGIYVARRGAARPGAPLVPEDRIADVLTEGFAREIPGPESLEWLRRCPETLRLRAVVIAGTLDQLPGLCRELREQRQALSQRAAARVAYFGDVDQPFRPKAITRFARCRSAGSREADQPRRCIPIRAWGLGTGAAGTG